MTSYNFKKHPGFETWLKAASEEAKRRKATHRQVLEEVEARRRQNLRQYRSKLRNEKAA